MFSVAHSENSHKTPGGHASGAERTPAVLRGKRQQSTTHLSLSSLPDAMRLGGPSEPPAPDYQPCVWPERGGLWSS